VAEGLDWAPIPEPKSKYTAQATALIHHFRNADPDLAHAVERVSCAHCGAKPGEICTTSGGHAWPYHAKRRSDGIVQLILKEERSEE